MKNKKDIEKNTENISPEISPAITSLTSRSGKVLSNLNISETEPLLEVTTEKKH